MVHFAPIKIANGICVPSVVQIEKSEDLSKVLGYKDNGTFQSLSPRRPNSKNPRKKVLYNLLFEKSENFQPCEAAESNSFFFYFCSIILIWAL